MVLYNIVLVSAYINTFVGFLIYLFIFNWRKSILFLLDYKANCFICPFVKFSHICVISLEQLDTHKQKNYPSHRPHSFQILTQNGS